MLRKIASSKLLVYLAIAFMVFIFAFPIFWMVATSFKKPADVQSMPPKWTFSPTLQNYAKAFSEEPLLQELFNSLIIAVSSTAIVLIVALPAAYSFARYDTGGGHLLFFILATRMFPAVAITVPYFMIFRTLHLIDTHVALIACYIMFNFPFATILLYGFFKEIPKQLEQAAMIDGYSRLDVLRKIVFPLIIPGASIVAAFCLLFAWNEFLFAFLLTRDVAKTVPVGVSAFWTHRGILWGPLSAAATICILPMMIFVIFLQRYIVRGLTFGAVKG